MKKLAACLLAIALAALSAHATVYVCDNYVVGKGPRPRVWGVQCVNGYSHDWSDWYGKCRVCDLDVVWAWNQNACGLYSFTALLGTSNVYYEGVEDTNISFGTWIGAEPCPSHDNGSLYQEWLVSITGACSCGCSGDGDPTPSAQYVDLILIDRHMCTQHSCNEYTALEPPCWDLFSDACDCRPTPLLVAAN